MRRLPLAFLLLSLALPFASAGVPAPEPVTEGSFEGTWFRVQKGERQALQIRKAEDGAYEVNFYWWTQGGLEIDTGFAERHEFAYRAFPGVLEIVVNKDASNPNEIVMRYARSQEGSRGSRLEESGSVRLYRALGGRKLVWAQDPMNVKVSVAEPVTPREKAGVVREETRTWIFRRVARRVVPWNEIDW